MISKTSQGSKLLLTALLSRQVLVYWKELPSNPFTLARSFSMAHNLGKLYASCVLSETLQ